VLKKRENKKTVLQVTILMFKKAERGWESSSAGILATIGEATVFFSSGRSWRCSCKDQWCVSEGRSSGWLRCFGGRVHTTWLMHIMARGTQIWGRNVQTFWDFVWSSDGLLR